MLNSLSKEGPGLFIDLGVGIGGFLLSLGWGRASGRTMDRDIVLFLAKIWGGIAVFGMILAFIM
jgi:hypothetical protein